MNSKSSFIKLINSSGEIDRKITNLNEEPRVSDQSATCGISKALRQPEIRLPNEVLNLIWSHMDIVKPRNVTVRCKKVGESFELWTNEPYSIALRVCRQSRQWFKDQHRNKLHNVASLAQTGGYIGPLNPLKNLWFNPQVDRICPIIEGDWSDEAFITLCSVMQTTGVASVAMIYTTKSDINENGQIKLVEWTEDVKLDMLQEKRRRIQINYKARPTFKRVSEAYADQKIADAQASFEGKVARKTPNLPFWLHQIKKEWDGLELQIMVEAGMVDRKEEHLVSEASFDDNSDNGDSGYEHSQYEAKEVGEEDDDEEPEEDESITDENSDDDIEN
ncbi:hypothetical protein ACHAP3_008650 [Botrytis cinerea]